MRAIGIDLGTTNSVAACCRNDPRSPAVMSNSFGENLTPSVVSLKRRRDSDRAERLVGRAALNNAVTAPEDTIFSIKRLMGRDHADPQIAEIITKYSYQVVSGPGDDPRAHVRFDGRDHTPSEISAWILEKIKEDASRALSDDVTHAVITVPAYFNDHQRAATREAGEKAGLSVKKIIDEPTAAAVAFGVQAGAGARHRILVYDMGGGTFDISILQMVRDQVGRDQYQVLQIEGDNWLGGDDFDRKIVQKITQWFLAEHKEDPSGDRRFLLLAKQHAEAAKKALSHAEQTDVVIPAAYKTSRGVVVDVDMPLTRAELNGMIQEYVTRSMSLVQKALAAQNLTPDDISDVLLVGGATLTPLVQQAVEGFFGNGKVRRSVNPMECVALGAAVLAATLKGVECPNVKCRETNDESSRQCSRCGTSLASGRALGETVLSETTAMALGISAVKGNQKDVFAPIIPKGTPYPLRDPLKQRFRPTSGRRILVPVYEGDKPVASQNAEVGVIDYDPGEEIEADKVVEVSFNYDRDRVLTVTINVPGTAHFKQETLVRNRPRTVAPVASAEPAAGGGWRDELSHSIEFALAFLEHYGSYMQPGERMKLSGDINRAQQAVVLPGNEIEGRRIDRLLQMDVFNCGLATQLFLADRAGEGAAPEVARQINDAARMVRQSHDGGQAEVANEQARLLKALVGKALEQRQDVKTLEAQEDYGGLLRLLGD